nr:2487_t:CDS:2 [Entrophospora candida]
MRTWKNKLINVPLELRIKKNAAAADIPKLEKWFGLSTSKGISLDNVDIRDGDNVEDRRVLLKRAIFEFLKRKPIKIDFPDEPLYTERNIRNLTPSWITSSIM